jgi:hypothetical protein
MAPSGQKTCTRLDISPRMLRRSEHHHQRQMDRIKPDPIVVGTHGSWARRTPAAASGQPQQ